MSRLRLAFVALSLASAAPGQLLIGATNLNGARLVLLDTATATPHAIAPITGAGSGVVQELAYDPGSNTAWFSYGISDTLHRVDLATGQATLVGAFGLAGSGVNMHGIAWDLSTSTLWGVPHLNHQLYAIDTGTAATTLVGSTGLTGFVNLAYDIGRDLLYATDSSTLSLYSIDRSTGTATLIGPHGSTVSNTTSLTYDIVTDTLFLADNTTSSLYAVDPTTGAATVIGTTGPGNLLGLTALPSGGFRREAHACGGLALDVDGAPLTGGTVTATLTSTTTLGAIGAGLVPGNTPFCACTIGHEWTAAVFGTTAPLVIPNNPTLTGFQFALQGLDLFAPSGCSPLQIVLSDTFVFVIG